MKPTNIITALTPQQHYALRRWFFISILLLLTVFLTLLTISIPPIMELLTIKKNCTLLRNKTTDNEILKKEYTVLTDEYKDLQKKKTKINNLLFQHKNPALYIKNIVTACGDSVILDGIRINKKNIELTLLCPTSEHATIFIKRLSATDLFSLIKLTSLSQDQHIQKLRCIIKSELK